MKCSKMKTKMITTTNEGYNETILVDYYTMQTRRKVLQVNTLYILIQALALLTQGRNFQECLLRHPQTFLQTFLSLKMTDMHNNNNYGKKKGGCSSKTQCLKIQNKQGIESSLPQFLILLLLVTWEVQHICIEYVNLTVVLTFNCYRSL